MIRALVAVLAVTVVVLAGGVETEAVPVDLELVLAADVSGSFDDADFALQRGGYEAAFRNAGLIDAIQSGAIGSIAVTLIYWSDAAVTAVPWTLINDAVSSNAFADLVAAAPRSSSGGTGLTNAINASAAAFGANGFEGTRSVIDVSGDGAESNVCGFADAVCAPLQAARAAALGGGVTTINALWLDDRDFFGDDPTDLINALTYGTTNVIGGVNPFQNIVQDTPDFAVAIRGKLIREVTGVPEPATILLLATGLAGLGGLALRRARRG